MSGDSIDARFSRLMAAEFPDGMDLDAHLGVLDPEPADMLSWVFREEPSDDEDDFVDDLDLPPAPTPQPWSPWSRWGVGLCLFGLVSLFSAFLRLPVPAWLWPAAVAALVSGGILLLVRALRRPPEEWDGIRL